METLRKRLHLKKRCRRQVKSQGTGSLRKRRPRIDVRTSQKAKALSENKQRAGKGLKNQLESMVKILYDILHS